MLCALNEETAPMIGVVVGVAFGVCLSFARPQERPKDRFRFLLCMMTGVLIAVAARALFVGTC